jgi:hypothetical protein
MTDQTRTAFEPTHAGLTLVSPPSTPATNNSPYPSWIDRKRFQELAACILRMTHGELKWVAKDLQSDSSATDTDADAIAETLYRYATRIIEQKEQPQ